MAEPPTIYDRAAREALRRRNAVQPHAMKRFLNAFFKKAFSPEDAIALLPESARDDFSRSLEFSVLREAERRKSKRDGAVKLLFRTPDGLPVESVLLHPETGRTALCVSSQVGCACGCAFCATGAMGFRRDLSAAEILDQVAFGARLARSEGRTLRNVVFMGMGEPLLNFDALCEAMELLLGIPCFNFAPSRITVSTVGIPGRMERFFGRFPKVRPALSLHAARQDLRERLMPTARAHPLPQLRRALERLAANGSVLIEYLLIDGVNDADVDLRALVEFLNGLPAHVNLIPFNAFAGCKLRGTPKPRRETFALRLKEAGFKTTLRHSLGADVEAACGQLARETSGT